MSLYLRPRRPRWHRVTLQVLGGLVFATMLAGIELCLVYAVVAPQP